MDKTLAQGLFEQGTVKLHQLGEKVTLSNGDIFRYAQVGGSNISKGKLQLAPVQKTNHHNQPAIAAVAVGAYEVRVDLGATALVANEYQDGYLVANDVAPEGDIYDIASHPAADSGTDVIVSLKTPVRTAITTSSEFTFVHNAWRKVVEGTTVTQRAAGVALINGTAAYYVWLKTRGVMPTLIGSAATLGADLIVGGTAGAVTDRTDALGASAEPVVAVADIVVGVATEYNPVRLVID